MKSDTRTFYEHAVHRAVEQVVTSLDGALDLETLAREAAMSPFHFHRVFRGAIGETPLELHRRLRMERAAWSLLHGEFPVTAIAFAAGYETHESFTRAFGAHYNRSPSEFRQSWRPGESTCARPPQLELATRSGLHYPLPSIRPLPIHFIHGDDPVQVSVRELPLLRLATVEHQGPYMQIAEAFARLGAIAGRSNLFGPESAMIGIFHDDPDITPAADLRSAAALVVSANAVLPPELQEDSIPAGRFATTTHVGPYEQLGDIWSRFFGEWLPRSGERVRDGASFEIYRNTPGDVPRDKLITELYIPLV